MTTLTGFSGDIYHETKIHALHTESELVQKILNTIGELIEISVDPEFVKMFHDKPAVVDRQVHWSQVPYRSQQVIVNGNPVCQSCCNGIHGHDTDCKVLLFNGHERTGQCCCTWRVKEK